jgi:hypothetical protein
MIKIELDTSAVEECIKRMHARVEHFKRVDIGAELSEWQVEDMHRHRPFTMRARAAGRASTVVRPHSLYEMLKSEGVRLEQRQLRHVRRGLKKHLRHPLQRPSRMRLREHRHWSTRPILRSLLMQDLASRYTELLAEKLKW